ncbi:putative odorant-binding protein A5 [Drosophila grimshawi]|uniref:GH11408 n=1 Tax=Drosophila grimshawi TaxID=7222 RepID=B4JA78_DROGR|nr:putative odorant-binding protein A5 [Drosophila grimshawi]EDW03752.1 GH11408 [Drosophila grimshawi]
MNSHYGLLLCVLVLFLGQTKADQDELNVVRVLKEMGVIPEVFKEPPQQLLKMRFENGVEIIEGETYTPTELKLQPELEWSADEGSYYTIMMISPDAPSRELPIYRSWIHWLVVNVPGTDVSKGQLLSEYFGPIPLKDSGLCRFVALVYHQSDKLDFDEQKMELKSSVDHSNFDVEKFTQKYDMSTPCAANVFQAKWDNSVPEMLKTLYDLTE